MINQVAGVDVMLNIGDEIRRRVVCDYDLFGVMSCVSLALGFLPAKYLL